MPRINPIWSKGGHYGPDNHETLGISTSFSCLNGPMKVICGILFLKFLKNQKDISNIFDIKGSLL